MSVLNNYFDKFNKENFKGYKKCCSSCTYGYSDARDDGACYDNNELIRCSNSKNSAVYVKEYGEVDKNDCREIVYGKEVYFNKDFCCIYYDDEFMDIVDLCYYDTEDGLTAKKLDECINKIDKDKKGLIYKIIVSAYSNGIREGIRKNRLPKLTDIVEQVGSDLFFGIYDNIPLYMTDTVDSGKFLIFSRQKKY